MDSRERGSKDGPSRDRSPEKDSEGRPLLARLRKITNRSVAASGVPAIALTLEEQRRLFENGEVEARLGSLLFGGPPRRQPTPPCGLALGPCGPFQPNHPGSASKLLGSDSATRSNAGLAGPRPAGRWFKFTRPDQASFSLNCLDPL